MQQVQCGDIHLSTIDRGQGKPLVLVHGFPLDHSMWQGQIDGLADACRVLAPDLRGFGQSDVTPGIVTMEQMADDLAALLDGLKISEPVTFCGLSMGGYVAWQFALRHAGRLGRLILCDTRAIADTPEAAEGRRKTAAKVLAQGANVVADAMLPKFFAPATSQNQPQLIEATRQVILRTHPDGIAAALLGMAQRPDVAGRLNKINVPALVICGQHDVISPPTEMRQIAQKLPQGRYVEIEDAGHMAPLEQPEAVNAAIREFLST